MLRKRFYFIVLVLLLAIPTAIVFAANSATLGVYQVDFISQVTNADDTDTFTYAVTGIGRGSALSHWTLGIDSCVDDFLVEPVDGDYYPTVTNITECTDGTYSCEASTYEVETGNDPTLGIYGIKFQDGSPQLNNGKTHVFQITVENFSFMDDVSVGAKYGGYTPTGDVTGPVCGGVTAVNLVSSNASSAALNSLMPLVLLALVLMSGVSAILWRKRAA